MEIQKVLVEIDGIDYTFSVEVMQEQDETIYRAVPDKVFNDTSPGYLEFDEKGSLQVDERFLNEEGRAVIAAIWEAIQRQVLMASMN